MKNIRCSSVVCQNYQCTFNKGSSSTFEVWRAGYEIKPFKECRKFKWENKRASV